jgi:prevent-host-death family protein
VWSAVSLEACSKLPGILTQVRITRSSWLRLYESERSLSPRGERGNHTIYFCELLRVTVRVSIGLIATVRFMKIRTITQRELRNQSAAVLREVEAGRTIIVSRNGTPVGELRPIKRRRFVPRAAIADAAGKAARIDAAQFRADLDAVVDPRPYD